MPNYRYPSSNCMRQGMRRPNGMQASQMTSANAANTNCMDNLSNMPVAMSYVPWSYWQNIYEPEKAFCRGTVFQNLDKPFRGVGGCQNVR